MWGPHCLQVSRKDAACWKVDHSATSGCRANGELDSAIIQWYSSPIRCKLPSLRSVSDKKLRMPNEMSTCQGPEVWKLFTIEDNGTDESQLDAQAAVPPPNTTLRRDLWASGHPMNPDTATWTPEFRETVWRSFSAVLMPTLAIQGLLQSSRRDLDKIL